ncbi:hypothetical protein [Roseixanthobacter liquoris]|uniref:hypothetical protein n=1 Tax=Roseixanthobacter liquoris TaxID=3119921 RepID=UPI00372B5456
MIKQWVLAAAFTAALTAAASAQAVKPYGQGFDGWVFTVTQEKPDLFNCRATRKLGGREDIMALRTNMDGYLSVKSEGRTGKFKGTLVNVIGQPRGRLEWTVTAEAAGPRMWFPLDLGAIGTLAAAGGFEFSLGDTEDTGKVNLGKRAGEAWARVNQCAIASQKKPGR